jgi:hypothetical protein
MGASALQTLYDAPTSNFVGLTDVQTLTNKTLTSPTVNGGTISSATLSNPTLSGTITFGTPLPVASGGTGASTFTTGNVLVMGATNVVATQTAPSGNFVGTTGAQTLDSKTLTNVAAISFSDATSSGSTMTRYVSKPTGQTLAFSTGPWATTPATVNIYFTVVGTGIVLVIQGYTAAAGATTGISSITSAALPSYLWPIAQVTGKIKCITNGAAQFGVYTLATSGTLTIALESGSWDVTGNNGFDGFAIPYMPA